jgi:long-subunit fatty acid transport protein
MPREARLSLHLISSLVAALAALFSAHGAGLYHDGTTARSTALGGQETAVADGPADALSGNPALLSKIKNVTLEATGSAGFIDGEFRRARGGEADLHDWGITPAGALGLRLGPATLALGFDPQIAARMQWRYRDVPGGLTGATSYGTRAQESETRLFRTALGAAWEFTPEFSAGASVGLLYNRNRLSAPYILQSQPILRGAKTLFDMETDGYGWDAQFGLAWKPVSALQLGASYTLASAIRTEGQARTDARRQFADLGAPGAPAKGTYDAEVTNHFPQRASLGATWQATKRLALAGEVEWINWADSFDDLDVQLRHGSNRALTSALGEDRLDDRIPLRWRDQWVWRAGVEYGLSESFTARAGYAYARNPVPAETLTPLTAAISEHTVSAGLGFKSGRFAVDAAWQWALPTSQHVDRSELLTGEYSHSDVRVGVQRVSVTTSVAF